MDAKSKLRDLSDRWLYLYHTRVGMGRGVNSALLEMDAIHAEMEKLKLEIGCDENGRLNMYAKKQRRCADEVCP
jgi:hypothetical protein